jgi:hypothetical protein
MGWRQLAVTAVAVAATIAVPAQADQPAVAPPVIAVIGEAGLNPAHLEFAARGAAMPALPPHKVLTLPRRGSFAELVEEMERGPLGRLTPGQLYRIAGTRLLVYVPADLQQPHNLIDGEVNSSGTPYRLHGTGAVASAIGARTGTAPNAWAVFIPTGEPSGFQWLAQQGWIDVATVSSYVAETGSTDHGFLPCRPAPHVREFTKDRVFFASSGNSDHSSLYLLNSMPEFYLVGGVDADGNAVMAPRVPTSPDEEEVAFSAPYATRTFESGDRYEFDSADSESVDRLRRFGGTSGAAPSTAGRAAVVVDTARRILRDPGRRAPDVLAAAPAGAKRPASGPLADGRLTSGELSELLHAVAQPQLAGPGRYAAEGYGALDAVAVALARDVLLGRVAADQRPDDDRAHAATEQARAAAFDARRCD